jgi:hypothetical protein
MAGPTHVKVTLTPLDLRKLDDWRLLQGMLSRAAAVRALLRLGLTSEGIDIAASGFRSKDFPVTNGTEE